MGDNTTISWCHKTFNLWHGCVKVGTACKNCYAETMSNRWKRDIWGVDKQRHFNAPAYYNNLEKWQRKAEKAGVAYRVFVMSMGDLFEIHRDPDINAQMVEKRGWFWDMVEQTPNLVYMILTKRPENIYELAPTAWQHTEGETVSFPSNVWIGTSIGDPSKLHRMSEIAKHKATVRFVSFEPLVEKISARMILAERLKSASLFDDTWLYITGGESGHGARPSEFGWFKEISRAAGAGGDRFFMKQTGGHLAKRMGLSHSKGEGHERVAFLSAIAGNAIGEFAVG